MSGLDGRWLATFVPVAVLLALWHVAVVTSGSLIFPTPWQVVVGLVDLARQGLLLKHVVASLFRVTYGYLLAAALAIPVGMLTGRFATAHALLNPLVQGLRPISPIAWIPLAILWFRGRRPLADLPHLPVVVLSDGGGHRGGRDDDRPQAHPGREQFRVHGIPAVPLRRPAGGLAPDRHGHAHRLGVAWLVVVAAEMIAVNSGLGYLIIDSRNAGNRYDLVVAGMVAIGVIGFLLDTLMRKLERLDEVRWRYET
jgi:NitT/TauT family transport system permease protein